MILRQFCVNVHPMVLSRVGHDKLPAALGAMAMSKGDDARQFGGDLSNLVVWHGHRKGYGFWSTRTQPQDAVAEAVPNLSGGQQFLELVPSNVPDEVDVRFRRGDAAILRQGCDILSVERHTENHAKVVAAALKRAQRRP